MITRLQQLGYGLLALIFLPFVFIVSVLAVLVWMVVMYFALLIPIALSGAVCFGLALILWVALVLPSLIIRGDYSWPCEAAKWAASPLFWWEETDYPDRIMEGFTDFVEDLWSPYAGLLGHLKGC